MDKEVYIKITANGPYLVYGVKKVSQKFIIADENNQPCKIEDGKTFEIVTPPARLCRCGKTKSAPFCDNSHVDEDFDGTETAEFSNALDNAVVYNGKNLKLYDNEKLCALARFCDAKGSIWNLIATGNAEDDTEAVRQANLCPSGRLMIFDNNGNPLEENLPQTVSILEDEGFQLSGPIFVSGKIRVESSNGKSYEIRNRQTLCRCGGSKNKPFCDCTHFYIKFKAE